MAGYVIGAGWLALAGWLWWSGRVPATAVRLPGTVVEEVSRRSTHVGRRRPLHAPRVAYVHPRTGADAVHEPTRFGSGRFAPGSRVELAYDPERDAVRLPDRSPRGPVVTSLVGLGFLLAEWAG